MAFCLTSRDTLCSFRARHSDSILFQPLSLSCRQYVVQHSCVLCRLCLMRLFCLICKHFFMQLSCFLRLSTRVYRFHICYWLHACYSKRHIITDCMPVKANDARLQTCELLEYYHSVFKIAWLEKKSSIYQFQDCRVQSLKTDTCVSAWSASSFVS